MREISRLNKSPSDMRSVSRDRNQMMRLGWVEKHGEKRMETQF